MTTPPYQPGPYGPNQDPDGQQPGGYGQYGQPRQHGQYGQGQGPEQGQYGQGQYGGQQYDPTQFVSGATQQWPGAGGGPGGPAPQPPKKQGPVVAIVLIAVLLIAGAGVGLYFLNKGSGGADTADKKTTTSAPDKTGKSTSDGEEETTTEETTEDPGEALDAQLGDCIKVNAASETNADVETVECTSEEAIYQVATRAETDTETCPSDAYVTYTEEGRLLLCLQLHVSTGDCLEVTDTDDRFVDCTSPDATYQVLDAQYGVDDETQCGEDATDVITYPQPALTICLGAAT
jgi:hypothetical protein